MYIVYNSRPWVTLQELVRVLKNFKSVRDPLRPRSSYIEQVILLSFKINLDAVIVSKLEKLHLPCTMSRVCDLHLPLTRS